MIKAGLLDSLLAVVVKGLRLGLLEDGLQAIANGRVDSVLLEDSVGTYQEGEVSIRTPLVPKASCLRYGVLPIIHSVAW